MSSEIKANTISEVTSANGVSIDGLNIKDSAINTGSISDSITFSSKYYLQGTLAGTHGLTSSTTYINSSGTSAPYFTLVGDNTNILPDTTNNTTDFKLIQAGIYMISFSATFYVSAGGYSRVCNAQIYGASSHTPTSVLSASKDNVANAFNADTDFGNASCSYVSAIPANYFVRFAVSGTNDNPTLHNTSHISIVLIRPTA